MRYGKALEVTWRKLKMVTEKTAVVATSKLQANYNHTANKLHPNYDEIGE